MSSSTLEAEVPASPVPATASTTRTARGLTIATVCGTLIVVVALAVGLAPVGDNSFLTHLATGRLMRAGEILRNDPYSFTAAGEPWVVQSWLASLAYGGLDALGGDRALQLFTAAVTAALGAVIWRLSRPASALLGRLLVVVPALAVAGLWSERPFLLGLLALALLLMLVDAPQPAWWAAPLLWLWANVHGSFPYAVVILGAIALGERADGVSTARTVAVLKWSFAGIAAALVNPYGPGLLTFPMQLLGRSDTLRNIVEWQAPSFTSWAQRAFLVQILAVMALSVRRPSWRVVIPSAVLIASSLISARNIVVASIVIVAVLAPSAAGVGSVAGERRLATGRVVMVLMAALASVMVVGAVSSPAGAYGAYPTGALAYLDETGRLDGTTRIVAPDYAGNFIAAAFGPAVPVFVDDRVEVYPASVIEAQVDLLGGDVRWRSILADVGADVLMWPTDRPLAALVREAEDWQIVYTDPDWLVAVPR